MSTSFTFEFSVGDRVLIREINTVGIIDAIMVDTYGHRYAVNFWNEGSREREWLFGSEIALKSEES